MNIDGITKLYVSQQKLQTQTTEATDKVAKAFASAASRIESERQTTSVQLSAYGKVKAGFARTEDAGKALATAKPATDTAEIRKGLQSLVSAYNDTRSAAATAGTGSASIAANALRRNALTDTNRSDLRALGVTQQQDGSLAFDTKTFDAAIQANPDALRSASTRVGEQFQQTASRTLASGSGLNSTLNSLTARAQSIDSRQAQQQEFANASQQSIQQQNNRLSNSLAGIASYQSIFTL